MHFAKKSAKLIQEKILSKHLLTDKFLILDIPKVMPYSNSEEIIYAQQQVR
jgi:hypothetical protein